MEITVQLKNLKKNYGRKEAVKGIDLDIRAGELFVLVGPNGAGKTTTLKMMVGLLKPTEGSVLICGHNMVHAPMPAKSCISFVPDTPHIYDKLNSLELLRFTGKLYKMSPRNIETQGEELLKFFTLWDVRDVLLEEFSHGMRQKAILASALLHNPQVFILDEPMVGLDPISIKSFKDLLRDKVRKGMTVIFSTHTLATAEELAHRIAIINQGRIMALGTMDELKKQYQSQENLEEMFVKLVNESYVKE